MIDFFADRCWENNEDVGEDDDVEEEGDESSMMVMMIALK